MLFFSLLSLEFALGSWLRRIFRQRCHGEQGLYAGPVGASSTAPTTHTLCTVGANYWPTPTRSGKLDGTPTVYALQAPCACTNYGIFVFGISQRSFWIILAGLSNSFSPARLLNSIKQGLRAMTRTALAPPSSDLLLFLRIN